MNQEQFERATAGFEEVPVVTAGKRCAMDWAPWCGDWFASSSPRNGNSNAEGPWDHWVELALGILQHPFSAKVHPAAHQAVAGIERRDLYDQADVYLTDEDLAAHFVTD